MTQTTDKESDEVVSTCVALSIETTSTLERVHKQEINLTMLGQGSVMSVRRRKLRFSFSIRTIDLKVLVPRFRNDRKVVVSFRVLDRRCNDCSCDFDDPTTVVVVRERGYRKVGASVRGVSMSKWIRSRGI